MLNDPIEREGRILNSWFRETYGRELTEEDMDRAEAWHLERNPAWDIWTEPGVNSVPGEAALTTIEWITALGATCEK